MRAWAMAFWLWLSEPPSDAGVRDVLAVATLLQGVVRLVDGLVFVLPAMRWASDGLYGVLQVGLALWVLGTRSCRWRGHWAGRWGAALLAGLFVVLALDTVTSRATSAAFAVVFAWVMAVEARYRCR